MFNFVKVQSKVSTGAQGNIQDIRRSIAEGEKYNTILFELLGKYTNKNPETVLADAERDLWLSSSEAVEYGIIDEVIANKKTLK